MALSSTFIRDVVKRFETYKSLGDKTFDQLQEKDFHYQPSGESNSIAIIIQHIYGNALSRWTNFLTEDGEKEWRKRDAEFEIINASKLNLLSLWKEAWELVFKTLNSLSEDDLLKTIYIRKEPLIVYDAILRQLAHYPYHVGQIVFIGKMIKDTEWQSLSIPKGKSIEYNQSLQ